MSFPPSGLRPSLDNRGRNARLANGIRCLYGAERAGEESRQREGGDDLSIHAKTSCRNLCARGVFARAYAPSPIRACAAAAKARNAGYSHPPLGAVNTQPLPA